MRPVSALVVSLCTLLATARALAAEPVIELGREADVLALFAPYRLKSEIAHGYSLWNVRISATHVDVEVRGPSDTVPILRLVHPERASRRAERSESFAIVRLSDSADASRAEVARALAERVKANDPGGFWRVERELSPSTSGEVLIGTSARNWLSDGLVMHLGLLLLAASLAVHWLRRQPPWMAGALVAICALGLGLRLAMSPEVPLGAWPYSRTYLHARLLFNGPGLMLLSRWTGQSFWLSEVTQAATLTAAAIAPLGVFAAAAAVFRDRRAALCAALVIATLPQHIRFSAAEDGGLPSVTLAALALALVVLWLDGESRVWSAVALLCLPPLLLWLFAMRPLNNAYGALLAVYALLPGVNGTRRRRALIVLLLAVLAIYGTIVLSREHSQAISATLEPSLAVNALLVLVHPGLDTLLNFGVTPPLLLAVAIYGGVVLFRQGRRGLVLWLMLWCVGFLVAHAVVPDPTMQPRYHLPLTIPLALLGGVGLIRLREWRRAALAAGFAYLLAAPVLYLEFIRDVDYAEHLEWRFVHELRARIPEGCRVIEYTGPNPEEARFRRVGAYVSAPFVKSRFESAPVLQSSNTESLAAEMRRLLATSPECTYVYEGLPCHGMKRDDQRIAPECELMLASAPLETVATLDVENRPYDRAALGGAGGVDRVKLTLHRVIYPRTGKP